MIYSNPGSDGAVVSFKPRYENFIGGEWAYNPWLTSHTSRWLYPATVD